MKRSDCYLWNILEKKQEKIFIKRTSKVPFLMEKKTV